MTFFKPRDFLTLILILITFFISAPNAYSEEAPLIPRAVLFGNPEKAMPALSPDGTKLGYLAPDGNGILNIWVRNLTDKSSVDTKITSDAKRGIRHYLWQYDNDHILYAQDRDGDENWHLFQVSLQTKEVKDLTPFDGATVSLLEYNHHHPDQILIQLNKRDKSLFDVYSLDLKNGSLILNTENKQRETSWLADNDLQVRASHAYGADGSSIIRYREKANSPWKVLFTTGAAEGDQELISFSKDGQFLYMISTLNANTGRLVKIDLKNGQQQVIVEDPDFDTSEVFMNPVTEEIEAVGVERDKFSWEGINPSVAEDFKKLQQDGAYFKIFSQDLTGKKWIVGYIYDNRSPRYYLYDRATKQKEFLFTTRPSLDDYPLSKMEPISYTARDGMKIHGYLTLPVGKETQNLPAIIYVHGGPHVRDSWGFDSKAQWLANRGYAVLQINYRGSAGYGKKYLNAGDREWGGKMQDDLVDGKQWLVKKGIANPEKVAIYGGSYGGYATLVGLTFTPEEFCCGVDIVGPSNLVTMMKSFPPYWGPSLVRFSLRVGNVETEPDFLKSRSPLFKADKIVKPLLIAQGANDPRVKQAESDQLVDVMRKNNLPVEYLLFPDEGHGFARPENQFKFFAAAEQFLSKYTLGVGSNLLH